LNSRNDFFSSAKRQSSGRPACIFRPGSKLAYLPHTRAVTGSASTALQLPHQRQRRPALSLFAFFMMAILFMPRSAEQDSALPSAHDEGDILGEQQWRYKTITIELAVKN
jgi:hypothetical protein